MDAPMRANCPITKPSKPLNASDPINIIVPKTPIITPKSFCRVIRSSAKNIPAIITVKNGVLALKMDVSPELICFWSQTIRKHGRALLHSPTIVKAHQYCLGLGILRFSANARPKSVIAASPTRNVTIVQGGR
jgi:hypothetical protein